MVQRAATAALVVLGLNSLGMPAVLPQASAPPPW